jgi:UDP-N-acetylmuramoyl-tripeptide--D-alanyl-D-alanine ligase
MASWNDYKIWTKGDIASIPTVLAAPLPKDIYTDSRDLAVGRWFLPLKGTNFDGHDFIETSMSNGAAGFFFEKDKRAKIPADLLAKGAQITDSFKFLTQVAGGWRETHKKIPLVAITGSSGKTTVKELTRLVCETAGPTLFSEASFNNEIGVPKTLMKIAPEHKHVIIEIGARHRGDISFLNKFVMPDVACLLNVGEAHLGEFGSVDNLIAAKLEIFSNTSQKACFVVNGDDPRLIGPVRNMGHRVISFGASANCEVRVTDVTRTAQRTKVVMNVVGESWTIEIPYVHEFIHSNVAAVVAIAKAFGLTAKAVNAGLANFKGVKGRYFEYRVGGKVVIDDSYNANPQSMMGGISTFARHFEGEKKVLLLGDMLELGTASEKIHGELGKSIASLMGSAYLITVGNHSREIGKGAIQKGFDSSRHFHYNDINDLLKNFSDIIKLGSHFFVKASRSIRLDQAVNQLTKE